MGIYHSVLKSHNPQSLPFISSLSLTHQDMSDFNQAEDEWWISDPETFTSFDKLPINSKWLARCITPSGHSKPRLEVFTDGQIHYLPELYAGPLMLLSLQELSCIAEAFSATDPKKKSQLWQNIHFIWRLRETILMTFKLQPNDKEDRIHPLLERWVVRLVHGVGNSPSNRRKSDEKLYILYDEYHHEVGKLEKGESDQRSGYSLDIIISF